jgi:ketopantoate hydroxymethyltransferase
MAGKVTLPALQQMKHNGQKITAVVTYDLVKEGGADLVKLDGASAFPGAVRAIARAGIPVWAQFGIRPQTAIKYGGVTAAAAEPATAMKDQLAADAKLLEEAGASFPISRTPDRSPGPRRSVPSRFP